MCEQRIVMKRWKKIPNSIEEKMKKPVFITIEEKNVNMPMLVCHCRARHVE